MLPLAGPMPLSLLSACSLGAPRCTCALRLLRFWYRRWQNRNAEGGRDLFNASLSSTKSSGDILLAPAADVEESVFSVHVEGEMSVSSWVAYLNHMDDNVRKEQQGTEGDAHIRVRFWTFYFHHNFHSITQSIFIKFILPRRNEE